ncbi:condensation protein [Streptomyces sp. NPDC051133]|uniref:condensation protein n=1 Tax=Streptomyces sp. NPDC051133 TaxID=3155521 RepID=UPI00342D4198
MEQFNPERHVRVLTVPDAASNRGAELLLSQGPPVRNGQPPWEIVLINRPGGYSLGFHADHGLFDGALITTLLRALLADLPTAGPVPPRPVRPRWAGLTSTLAQQVALLEAAQPTPAFTASNRDPRRVRHADVPVAQLRVLARAHGTSVNDVYLAALARAVHLWQQRRSDITHPPLATGVPVSFRRAEEEGALGNRSGVAHIVLPCDDPSPVQTLRRVTLQTARQKELRQRDALRLLTALTPGAAAVRLVGRLAPPLTASNVTFGSALTYRGAIAQAAYGIIDVHGPNQVFTSLVSHHDSARLTLVHHPDTPIGPHLPALWLTALQEMDPDSQEASGEIGSMTS